LEIIFIFKLFYNLEETRQVLDQRIAKLWRYSVISVHAY